MDETPPVTPETVGVVQVYVVPESSVTTEKLKGTPEHVVSVCVCPATVLNNGNKHISRTNLFIYPIGFSIACKLLYATGIGFRDIAINHVVLTLQCEDTQSPEYAVLSTCLH